MANQTLNKDQLEQARALLAEIRERIDHLSGGDKGLLFAFRRKVYKELIYDERDKPMVRRRLKKLKFAEQNGICPVCNEALPTTYTVLDRLKAADGYTLENTRLIHQACDTEIQRSRGYS